MPALAEELNLSSSLSSKNSHCNSVPDKYDKEVALNCSYVPIQNADFYISYQNSCFSQSSISKNYGSE